MLSAKPEAILISERQRKKFDEAPLSDLENSIDANGLIHPPAVRRTDTGYALVAGERRMRACARLIALGKTIRCGDFVAPAGAIPVLDLGNLSDLAAFEAELDENIKRENLSWQERAMAEAKLLELRSEQNAAAGIPKPTLTAIATEIVQRKTPAATTAEGSQVTAVATRIRLAEHLDDPDVAKAKTEAEAVKIVRKKAEQVRIQTLAAAHDSALERGCPHTLLQGDFRGHIQSLAEASVDVLLTDPPYGIAADTFGEQSGQGHNYEDSVEYFEEIIATLAEESYRVCKTQAHAYVFCDPRRFIDLQTHFELAGWKVWPIPLIWAKGNGMLPRPEHAPRRTYEAILFASKGDKPVRCVKGDVISVSGVRDLKHGAQKPVDLYVDLLSRSAVPGDVVLDTFAGSGTIFPAANRAKCKAIGIELDSHNAAICQTRMMAEEDEVPGLEELEL